MIFCKRVDDAAEAAWTQDVLSRIEEDGFRVARPLRTANGDWVEDGWIASEFIEGLRPAAPDWDLVIDAGLRFGEAAERVRTSDIPPRTHRWAVADRVAWDEDDAELRPDALDVFEKLCTLRADAPAEERTFCHGDLTGNVFVDPAGVPVMLDVSPYLRPGRWAEAVVVADALLWFAGDPSLVRRCERDLLVRALQFRLVAEQLAPGEARHGAELDPYRRVLTILR